MADALPSVADLAEIGRQSLQTDLDPNGTGAVNVSAGSRNDMALSINAAMYSRVSRYAADRVRAASPADATESDLDTLAQDRFGEKRKAAVASSGTVYFTRTGTSATSIPKGTRVSVPATASSQAVTFETTETVSVAVSVTSVSAPIQCIETGVIGNVSLSSITSILDTLDDTSWIINPSPVSPNPLGGGADRETDQELQRRLTARSLDDDLKPGPLSSVLAGAMRVPGVAFATLIEPLDGTLILYVGDSGFQLTGDMQSAISAELLKWRAYGIPVIIRPFGTIRVQVTATIHMKKPLVNYDTQTVKENGVSAIKDYFANQVNQDEYYLSGIESALFSAQAGEVQTVILSSPSADVVRQADTAYAGVPTLTRYVVDDSSISVTVLDPLVV